MTMHAEETYTAEDVAFYAGSAHARGDVNSRLPAGSSAAQRAAWLDGVRCGSRIKLRYREQALSDRRCAGYERRH